MTSVVFTPELEEQFEEFLNESVDWHVDGTPISRRSTYSPGSTELFALKFGWMAHAAWVKERAGAEPGTLKWCKNCGEGVTPGVCRKPGVQAEKRVERLRTMGNIFQQAQADGVEVDVAGKDSK